MIDRFILPFLILFSSIVHAQSEGWAISNSGANLYFKMVGSGSPVLVVSDAGNSSAYMMDLINKLSENHRVVYFDTRATGKSRLPIIHDSTINFKKALADIEGLRAVVRIPKWSIVAHGFGAVVAAAYSAQYPQNVEQVVLINPAAIHLKYREYDPYSDTFEDYDFTPMLKHANLTKRFDDLQRKIMGLKDQKDTVTRWQYINEFQAATYVYDTLNQPLAVNFLQERVKNVKVKQLLRENWERRYLTVLRQYKGSVMVMVSKNRRTYRDVTQSWRDSLQNCKMVSIDKAYHFPWVDNSSSFYPEIQAFLTQRNNRTLISNDTSYGNTKKVSRPVGRGNQRGKRT